MTAPDAYRPTGGVALKPGREAAVLRGHPWVYRGALAGPLPPGMGPVELRSSDGRRLGIALPGASGGSLALRMVAGGDERWDRQGLARRLADAAAMRGRLRLDADAYRLVHAEGDRLSGLVIDRYGEWAVVQPFEPAWQPYLDDIASVLIAEQGCRAVLVRPAWTGAGGVRALAGQLPTAPVVIREGRVRFPVDLVSGQKTGFFLDQRDNRSRLAELAGGATLLNLFSYSGGFAIAALVGGARRGINVDASAEAIALARRAYELNRLAGDEGDFVCGDAFGVTRALVGGGARFDVVVVDPPAFVKTRADLSRGLAGYRDINLQALRLVAPGGLLLTCSCSASVGEEHFSGAVLAAALDAGRDVRVLERRSAGPDHPVLLACPETRHLKALLCRVM